MTIVGWARYEYYLKHRVTGKVIELKSKAELDEKDRDEYLSSLPEWEFCCRTIVEER